MTTPSDNAHAMLMACFAEHDVAPREISHPPEGETRRASLLRGHPLAAAAKTLVLRVGLGGKRRRYVLAVIDGESQVDKAAVAAAFCGRNAYFADRATAERLTGCVSGSVMPLSFDPELAVIADAKLLDQPVLYFNAGRLDLSVAVETAQWLAVASPRIDTIALNEEPQRKVRAA